MTAGTSDASIRGRVISPGVAFGLALLDEPLLVPAGRVTLDEGGVVTEIAKLDEAVQLVHDHLEAHVREHHAPAEQDLQAIIAAHVMMLDDRGFFSSIKERIERDRVVANDAVRDSFQAGIQRLAASNDDYMRARAEDLRDLCQTLQRAILLGARAFELPRKTTDPPVFVSPYLRLSVVLRARRAGAAAFVTSSVAFTSHGAIFLRASGIPAVGGVPLEKMGIELGIPLLVDANEGVVSVRPPAHVRDDVLARHRESSLSIAEPDLPPLPAKMPGGEEIHLWANINHPSQSDLCRRYRMTGVGLFRTEFLALDQGRVPNEDEQYEAYRRVVDALAGRPLVVRTFDFGADKEPGGLDQGVGRNPALGVRGIRRHVLNCPEELRQQLRAILRASVGADVRVLIPVVTTIADVRSARGFLDDARADLERSNTPFNTTIKVGAMIETPSAALQVDRLLGVVDFVSVGTNDLLQYLTAADRNNPEVLAYHDPESSGLYRLLKIVMQTAGSMGRAGDVCVCGELASEPDGAVTLAEIGLRCLSITPAAAPAVRAALAGKSLREVERVRNANR